MMRPNMISITAALACAGVILSAPADDWQDLSPPTPPGGGWLHAVDGVATDDVWAVGFEKRYYNQYSYDSYSYLVHWDGSTWTRVPSPSPGLYERGGIKVELRSIAAIASDDVWAMGTHWTQHPGDGFVGYQTLAMHWDGESWEHVPTPVTPVGGTGGFINDIGVIASDNVYAAGFRVDVDPNNSAQSVGLLLHWDGSTWTELETPPIVSIFHQLRGISVVDNGDIWLVGGTGVLRNTPDPYIVRFDGDGYDLVSGLEEPGYANFIHDVFATSEDDIWAVGKTAFVDAGSRPLFYHYDGTDWSLVVSEAFDRYNGDLRGISGFAADALFAAGLHTTEDRLTRLLIMHYDGTEWVEVPTDPNGPNATLFYDLNVIDGSEAWAVGNSLEDQHAQRHVREGSSRASLEDLAVIEGSISSGGVPQLVESDDQVVDFEARVTGEVAQPHLLVFDVGASSDINPAASMTITYESRITDIEAAAWVYLRNWSSGQFDQVDSFTVGMSETIRVINVADGADYVRASDGRLEVRVKSIVYLPFTLGGFHKLADQIAIDIE